MRAHIQQFFLIHAIARNSRSNIAAAAAAAKNQHLINVYKHAKQIFRYSLWLVPAAAAVAAAEAGAAAAATAVAAMIALLVATAAAENNQHHRKRAIYSAVSS